MTEHECRDHVDRLRRDMEERFSEMWQRVNPIAEDRGVIEHRLRSMEGTVSRMSLSFDGLREKLEADTNQRIGAFKFVRVGWAFGGAGAGIVIALVAVIAWLHGA